MARRHQKISDDEAARVVRARVDFHGQTSERAPFERQVLKNRAFFFGKQHFLEDSTGRLRNPTKVSPHRVFYKANFVMGNVLRSMLTVTGAKGEFVVPPKDSSRKAQHAAWVSTKLFEHLAYISDMDEREQMATLFAAIDGSVIWKVSWDADAGELDRYYWADSSGKQVLADPDDRMRAALEDEGKYDDLPRGEVAAEPFPWSQCFWDWNARETGFERANWAAQVTAIKIPKLAELYGEELAARVRPDEALSGSLYYDEVISFMATSFGATNAYQRNDEDYKDLTLLVEYWERPSSSNGMLGRNIHYAGDVVLRNRDNPYRLTGYPLPLVKQDWIKAPGRFLGLSLVEQLTSAQQQLNLAVATIAEHQRIYGHPATLVPKNSGIPTGHLTLQPGTVHEYEPTGGKIEFGPTPTLPKEVFQNFEIQRMVMADISSQQSLDGSKLPGQLRSGPALEAIFEERNKMLAHPARNYLTTKARIGRQMLALAKWKYDENRIVSYIGEDKRFRALSFVKADLQTDLRVLIDRANLLSSPSAERARMLEMLQAGALDPENRPEDREAVFKAFDIGGVQEMISDRMQEEDNQEREIEEMVSDPIRWLRPRVDQNAPPAMDPRTGQPGPPPMIQGYPLGEFDDHRARMKVLVRYIRSEEYRSLDPLAQQVVLVNARMRQAIVQRQDMQNLMLQAQLRGGAKQKGTPSRPKVTASQ